MRAICLHGHYYQPPREDPWLGVAPPEPSAAPDRDWNTRITRECYAPAMAARLLDGAGRLRDVVNLYEWSSFDAAPTLLEWLAPHAPALMAGLQRADVASRARTGFGNGWGQPYVHAILPLAAPWDVKTLVHWGRRDFEHRFGRSPEGMWLPEMAVDVPALSALAEAGVTLTLLAPHQAARIRPLGDPDAAWTAITPETLDIRQLYRCRLPEGRVIDVLFRDARRSQDIAFGALLRDGEELARELFAALGDGDGAMLSIAVDGETYGHHHRFAEMAVAYAVDQLRRRGDVEVTNPAAFRATHPPTHEVEIAPNTSWSCAHGVERWRSDCGCHTGGDAGWTQAWRAPLRGAIDWLRDEVAVLYETRAGDHLRDPWGARDRYVDCLLAPGRTESFVAAEGRGRQSPGDTTRARSALEMARHALLMQTSCGWFFDDLAGIEPLLNLRHAARTIELAERLGRRLEAGFLERLAAGRSNLTAEGNGADIFRTHVRRDAPTVARVGATAALLRLEGQATDVPGYDVAFADEPAREGIAAVVRVVETSTGAREQIAVTARHVAGEAARAEVGSASYGLGDLFSVQQERLLTALTAETWAVARDGSRQALAHARALLAALHTTVVPLPSGLAVLVGYEEAEAAGALLLSGEAPVAGVRQHLAALARQGVRIPRAALEGPVVAALTARIGALPGTAGDCLELLDLADAVGLQFDVGAVQVRLLEWWQAATAEARGKAGVRALLDRLRVAPGPPASPSH